MVVRLNKKYSEIEVPSAPVGEGQGGLANYSLRDCKEPDMTGHTKTTAFVSHKSIPSTR